MYAPPPPPILKLLLCDVYIFVWIKKEDIFKHIINYHSFKKCLTTVLFGGWCLRAHLDLNSDVV